jgi:hypothetical protein
MEYDIRTLDLSSLGEKSKTLSWKSDHKSSNNGLSGQGITGNICLVLFVPKGAKIE